jgi:Xaa-Pro aminopeptidase
MTAKVPHAELADRMQRFRSRMDAVAPAWRLAAFLGRVNQYYFTGTMQDSLLLVPRDGEPVLWVRRSFERAGDESLFPDIRPMKSFRDPAAALATAAELPVLHLETELVPLGLAQRFRKHFACAKLASLDAAAASVRAVKSPYELAILERAGAIHRRVLEAGVPALLRAGMSELEFACELQSLLLQEGHEGVLRFNMFNVDMSLGQLGFGENSLYPTSFNGPGGCRGLGPAAPLWGDRERKLQRGDLVFADVGCTVEGYSTDKTMIYAFGQPLPDDALAAHRRCLALQRTLAAALTPGAVPAEIHARTVAELDPELRENFMGFGSRRVNFLGHGVGLQIDEPPVIAEGFDEPLVEGMVLALEPKKGIAGVGMVGSENTYVVTPAGGRSLTGEPSDPILVPA